MKKIKRGPETTIKEVALRNLGVSSTDEINEWFKRSYAGQYRIDGIDEAIRILDSRKWDRIQIVGDYDIDGCTATAQFRLVLKALGYPVYDRIPKRFSEGFGLNPKIVSEIPDGENLVITCDNGIAALDAIELAKERGFTVIVTDHHLPIVEDGKTVLPEADLIIDPNAIEGSADFNGYCGSGIVYKLLTQLLKTKEQTADDTQKRTLQSLRCVIEPLAMMGTIGDVMKLQEENYVIARNGLKKLANRNATAGMLALHDALWVTNPTASDIGFKSGPCINANGRLLDDGAAKSVDLLACSNYRLASEMAQETVRRNNERKKLVENGFQMAEQFIAVNHCENDLPLIVVLNGVNEGIIGIIAGKLCEKYGTVAIVLTDSEKPGILKGSGRSIPGIDLKKMLDDSAALLVGYGGHEGAAGLSIEQNKVMEFRKMTNEYAENNGMTHLPVSELMYDLEIDAKDIKEALDETLRYGPFGEGNPAVVFKVNHFHLVPGNDGKLKTYIGAAGVKLTSEYGQALGFGLADRMTKATAMDFTLYGTLSYSYFKGEATPTVEIIDFEEELSEKPETPLMRAIRMQAQK